MAIVITAENLKDAGYEIANNVPQELITRCVSDILEAYIVPILPEYSEADADVLKAIYCLTYLLLLARNVVKTRYGARQKNVDESQTVSSEEKEILKSTADMYLQKLISKEGAELEPDYFDIARIYNFNTIIK